MVTGKAGIRQSMTAFLKTLSDEFFFFFVAFFSLRRTYIKEIKLKTTFLSISLVECYESLSDAKILLEKAYVM